MKMGVESDSSRSRGRPAAEGGQRGRRPFCAELLAACYEKYEIGARRCRCPGTAERRSGRVIQKGAGQGRAGGRTGGWADGRTDGRADRRGQGGRKGGGGGGGQLLLARGVVGDAVNPQDGATAFHYACKNSHPECAEVLVETAGRAGRQREGARGPRSVLAGVVRGRHPASGGSDLVGDALEVGGDEADGPGRLGAVKRP
jgi:hypothetical protein